MLNIHARDAVGKVLSPVGRALSNAGVSPDAITVVGTAATVAASLTLFPRGYWFAGALVVGALACLDLLDGAVARAGGRTTKFGAVLDSIFGGSSSSRLFREVREVRGLAYSVGSYNEQYTDSGLVATYVGTREDNVEEACSIIGAASAAYCMSCLSVSSNFRSRLA